MSLFKFDFASTARRSRAATYSPPLLAGLMCLCLFGCSADERAKIADTVTAGKDRFVEKTEAVASKISETAQEVLPPTGKITLVSPSVTFDVARVELIAVGDGRNVVQITNYDIGQGPSSPPAILIHGRTDITSVSGLAGNPVKCDLYFRSTFSAPVAMTAPGETVEVSFKNFNADDNTLDASFGPVTLMGADAVDVPIGGGTITAVIATEGTTNE